MLYLRKGPAQEKHYFEDRKRREKANHLAGFEPTASLLLCYYDTTTAHFFVGTCSRISFKMR